MSTSLKSLFLSASAASALSMGLLALDSTPAMACGAEPYIGSICTYSFDWCPYSYLPADGRTVAVRDYQALFALIGFSYGGDNANNFKIPDMRGRSVVGTGTGPGLTSVPITQMRGQEGLILNTSQVPLIPHTHTAIFTGTGGGGGTPLSVTIPVATGNGNASTVTNGQTVSLAGLSIVDADGNVTYSGPYTTSAPTTQGKIVATASGGSGGITGGTVTVAPAGTNATQVTPTLPPQLGQTVCIAVNGLYPSRP